jgi:hypothetical protein
MGEQGHSSRDQNMIDLLESMAHRWSKQLCRVGFEERSKEAAREITVNQRYQRIDLEICRACIFF